MKSKEKPQGQSSIFTSLKDTINPKHPLYQLEKLIPWEVFEEAYEDTYSDYGRPAKPIRLMVSLMILKHTYNLSDEETVAQWEENPYWQYFSGEEVFQWRYPCDPTDLVYFRKRIGEEGVEKLFEVSVKLHGKKAMEKEVIADTTVQEKNITFPTDSKLQKRVIQWVWKISDKNNIKLRQSYRRTVPKLEWKLRYIGRPKRDKEGRRAARKLKTITGRLLRDLEREMTEEQKRIYSEELINSHKILEQTRNSKDKIYSFHEPDVKCISKGKKHKRYEFGSKVSILTTKNSNIIVGAVNFTENIYDGNTLPPALDQYKRLMGKDAKAVLVDEGYRGRSTIGNTKVLRVHQKSIKGLSRWQKRQRFRRRSAIEPIIGHLKADYRLGRNFLKGVIGDSINLLISCMAFNIKKLINQLIFAFLKLFHVVKGTLTDNFLAFAS